VNIKRIYQLFFIIVICCAGCSAERKNIISKTYHNTAARFNAYFYASKQIEAIENKIQEHNESNYGKVLWVFPQLDSALAVSYQENVDEAIKMAGIAIERHKNSKWVDDSWILAGRARYYALEFENAIETFKYVNKHGDDDDAKHEALIRLIHTFTDYGEYANALAVSHYLDKKELKKRNEKLLYLTLAYFYQVQNDLDNMVRNLVKAAPMLNKKEGRARTYFIIGQIYQKLGFESEAYNNYKQSLSSNPEYELDFHARLNMAQVTQLKNTSDLKSARKVFIKLLKDKKNKEFKDKIYYEWGVFEAKQNNLNKALEYFKLALSHSQSNDRQKGLAYYQQATIFYDSLRNYKMAQAYYDSTVSTLPRDEEVNFMVIDKRNKVLDEFVKYFNTIERNDSLLNLAKMDTASLYAFLKDQVEEKQKVHEQAREATKKRTAKRAPAASSSFYMDENTTVASNWYFDNPSAIAIGQNEFLKTWGSRPLVDYWRISEKIEQQELRSERAAQDATGATEAVEAAIEETFDVDNEVNQLISELPLTEEEQKIYLNEIEEAYYHLGNIYSLSLGEKINAAEAFETLLKRFPATIHESEVLYQLFLIYKAQSNEIYKKYEQLLISKYPNSRYTRLIKNPNYAEEANATAEQQKKIYQQAYQIYDSGNYTVALGLLNDALKEFEETYFTSHLELLKIMAIGKTEDISQYQFKLAEFIEKYPDSELKAYAKKLLKASRDFQDNRVREKGVAYIPYFEQQHYFVALYPSSSRMNDFTAALESFNDKFEYLDLKTSNLILNDEYTMILVTDFKNREFAIEYLDEFFESKELINAMPNFNLVKFVISKDNFNIFYQTKALKEYLEFFDKFY
jgi:outer membrane protein assembly factor BamD (BamD/ComL family)